MFQVRSRNRRKDRLIVIHVFTKQILYTIVQIKRTSIVIYVIVVDVIVYIVNLLVPLYAPFSSIAERSIFLSQTPNACSSEDVIVQVSAAYNKIGNMSD